MDTQVCIGIDVGTSGVRAAAVCGAHTVAAAQRPLAAPSSPNPGWSEQDADSWWSAVTKVLREITAALQGRRIAAVCVDSTSGTLVAVDAEGRPLRPAILYNDARSSAEGETLNEVGRDLTERMGYRFNSSYALAKALWLIRQEPALASEARFIHAADFISGRLTGDFLLTDYSNALKMGYDLIEDRWPDWLSQVGLRTDRLPQVHRTGELVGCVGAAAAHETGLPEGCPVAAGPTDGVAAFYASGAVRPGDAATTLGTTLVFKSLSRRILRDPLGRVYTHKHADGFWLPGGASNCGGAYVTRHFGGMPLDALTGDAARYLPCSVFLYPLCGRGERFPVVNAQAERFVSAEPSCAAEHFAAYLQGMAFVERWGYETLAELGGDVDGPVYTSGGGSRSDLWMQLRADVLGRETVRTGAPDSAFGSAILAASQTVYSGIGDAVRAMVTVERRFAPRSAMHRRYGILYRRFRAECAERSIR